MIQRSGLSHFQNLLRLCLGLICFLVAGLATASPCGDVKDRFFQRFETLQKATQSQFGEIVSNPENFPVWQVPSDDSNGELVYLIHGFLGSPFEMKSTADALIQSGYTVVRDILPGHGVSADTANSFSAQQIEDHVFSNLNELKSCKQKIHLIGFSTGATLLHHYLQKNSSSHVTSVTLISPFYQPSFLFADLLSYGASLFTSTLSIDFAYRATRFPDIKVAYLDPDHYFQELPLLMAQEISSLGKITFLTKARIEVPVLLLTTFHDKTASPLATHAKMAADFESMQLMHYGPWMFAPHHIMAETVSPAARHAHEVVKTFVNQH